MAIYGNFKGTTQSAFQIGKTGGSIHSSLSQPVSPSTGDLWIDTSNTAVRVYDGADWDNGQFIGNLEGYMEYEAKAGENLVKGDVVYVSGNSGNTPIVSKAQGNANGAKMPAFGICTQNINSNETGYIVTQGLITGIDTSAFTSGDTLYVSATTAGEVVNVSPAGESNKIQNIGKVVKSGNGGSILVGGAGRFNATSALDNGNIFLGDSTNRAVTANLDVSVGSLGFVKSNAGIGGFVYHQSVAANVWSVSHNLGQQYLNIEIVDDTGNSITGTYGYPTINFVNDNQLTATFTTPTAGYLVASSGQGYTGSSGLTATLQQVTDNGSTTTNGLTVDSLQTTTITSGNNSTAGTITGDWTLTAGSTWQATYADLAEKYTTDHDYDAGTVVKFGGNYELTQSDISNDTSVAGVISDAPAFTMNGGIDGQCLALAGRVPVKVVGEVQPGDLLVTSDVPGHAIVNNQAETGTVLGKAISVDSEGMCEALVILM